MSTSQTSTPTPRPQRSSATKPLMILFAIIGGVTLLAILLTTVFASVIGLSRGSATLTADTSGVTSLDVDASASRFDLEFDDVTEATLETSGLNATRWDMHRNGDELVVEAPSRWASWCIFTCDNGDNQVTLTLPEELNDGSLNAELGLNAGRLFADGDFDTLSVELNAGEVNVNGTTRALDAELNAGSANLNLADVDTANFEVAAGRLTAELTGSAPTTTDIEVNAGRLLLTLPNDSYTVTSDVAAGMLDNQLGNDATAANSIAVEVAAGNVTLQPGATP